MAAAEKRTFSLPTEQAHYIDNLVASGTYATSSEVIRAGLRALQERDAAMDRWLREEVVPVATAMQADPSRAIAADQVFDEIRALHASGRGPDPWRVGSSSPGSARRPAGLYLFIAERDGEDRAMAYIERIEAHCRGFADFPERGTRRMTCCRGCASRDLSGGSRSPSTSAPIR